MTIDLKGAYDCVKAFTERDPTADPKQIAVPTLIIQGGDDQIACTWMPDRGKPS